jgi:hypothetical protein
LFCTYHTHLLCLSPMFPSLHKQPFSGCSLITILLSLIGSPSSLERANGNRWVGLHVIYCVFQHAPCCACCLWC